MVAACIALCVRTESANVADEKLTVMELHRRMGHIAPDTSRKLVEKGFVTGVRLDMSSGMPQFCEACVYAKATRKPAKKVKVGDRAGEFGDKIHSDVWGPAPIRSLGGRRYYVTFTDDKTRLTQIHFLKSKDETFDAYKEFEAWAQTQKDATTKRLHSDRGGEYLGKEFILHLKNRGTEHELTVHDTEDIKSA
jgi:hypothetical protein